MFGGGNFGPYTMPYNNIGLGAAGFGGNAFRSAFGNSSALANGLARGGGLAGMAGRTGGLFSRLRGGINWSGLITNTGKTLDVINRAIPIVKQAGPMFNNMKTMFRLASAFKDESADEPKEKPISKTTNESQKQTEENTDSHISSLKVSGSSPSFFI